MSLERSAREGGASWQGTAERESSPGKTTLTARLAPRRASPTQSDDSPPLAADATVQLLAAGGGAAEDPFAVHLLAGRGVEGPGADLPHGAAIQRSFGHHDVSGVQAHVGGAARQAASAIGAAAYATGDRVAFAAEPDLRQAAHEAAHVVQQRGGVRLDGGVGARGDRYERHADEVAELVVRGESAESLLDQLAHRGSAGGPAVQRLEAGDVDANVLSLTSTSARGELDDRSRRRLWERLCEVCPELDAGAWDRTPEPEAREALLRDAIHAFQTSSTGAAMIDEIARANAATDGDGDRLYEPPAPGDRLARFTAHSAELHADEVLANDVTAQALANVWPQRVFGRMMSEEQAYHALAAVVQARGLTFQGDGVNVIGVRAYQGGEVHDNDEELIFTDRNVYNDTQFIAWKAGNQHRVRQARGTVDPGGPRAGAAAAGDASAGAGPGADADGDASAASATAPARPARRRDLTFAVEADQEWTYSGTPHGRTAKYDRALYGLLEPLAVERGRRWREHPEEAAAASERTGGGGGRVIRRRDGRLETDRDADGDARLVSAVHSGGNGGAHGDRVFGDSTGCSVVHGSWFAYFNETLGGAAAATGAVDGDSGAARFSYALIDPRLFAPGELDALLEPIAPSGGGAAGGGGGAAGGGGGS